MISDTIIQALILLIFIYCIWGIYIFFRSTNHNAIFPISRFLTILIVFIYLLIGYGCLVLSNHYSVDSFNLLFDMGPYWHLQLGRYLNCGIMLWAQAFSIHPVVSQRFFAALWILSATFSTYIISAAFHKIFHPQKVGNSLLLTSAISLTFINVFMMELALFPEILMVNTIGLLTLSLSIWFALSDFSPAKKWGCTFAFLVIALGNYQSYIGIFEAFSLIGIVFKFSTESYSRRKNLFFSLLVGGGASIVNILIVKILISLGVIVDSGRGVSHSSITFVENIIAIFKYQFRFWKNADGLLPNIIMLVIGIILIYLLKNIISSTSISMTIEFCLSIIVAYILAYAPHLIEKQILLTPRSNIAIWSVIAVCLSIDGITLKSNTLRTICIGGLLLVNILSMQDMAANTQMVNAIDFTEANQICTAIHEYENQSGNYISQIAVKNDIKPTTYQPYSRYKNSELGARILITPYSGYRLIGYLLGRNVNKIDMPEDIYAVHFVDKDWDCLNLAEQLYCQDNTAYLMIY